MFETVKVCGLIIDVYAYKLHLHVTEVMKFEVVENVKWNPEVVGFCWLCGGVCAYTYRSSVCV